MTFDSLKQCSIHINVNHTSLKDTYLDKPRQIVGYSIRSEGFHVWNPPENMVFDTENVVKISLPIISIDVKTEKVVLYKGQSAACRKMGWERSVLKYAIQHGTVYKGFYWKKYTGKLGNFTTI